MVSFNKDSVLGDVIKIPGFVLGLNTYNGRKEILAALKNHLSMTTPLITAHQIMFLNTCYVASAEFSSGDVKW